MEIVYNIWLAFNIVFGIWSTKNWIKWVYAKFADLIYNQSQTGKMIDLFVMVSILSFVFTFHK